MNLILFHGKRFKEFIIFKKHFNHFLNLNENENSFFKQSLL
jgi:hypothetical protein